MPTLTSRIWSIGTGSAVSTTETVEQAVRGLGNGPKPVVLAMVGGKHCPTEVAATLEKLLPESRRIGGSAAGIITRDLCGYTGLEIALLAFHDPNVAPMVLVAHGLQASEYDTGKSLGEELLLQSSDGAFVMLFYDSVATSVPLTLHPASEIVAGIKAGLAGKHVHLVGGGLITDLSLTSAWILDGREVRRHAAVALVFPSGVEADTLVAHGCRPVSDFLEITRIEGQTVLEIDGEPALPLLERMLGIHLGGDDATGLSLIATLGQRHEGVDRFAPFQEGDYVNRLIVTADRTKGSVTLFERDFHVGSVVQIMVRDNDLMIRSLQEAANRANRLFRRRRQDTLAIYVDCGGRASVRTGSRQEEAEVLVKRLDPDMPLFGFYAGVEIAPIRNEIRALDWSGVLTISSTGI